MKKTVSILIALVLAAGTATAGELQKELKRRWLGAWVVTRAESYSDCSGLYTDNRINGNLVKSKGRISFLKGELAKLQKVDAKRSRLDLMLVFQEPLRVPYQEGPFTLYRQDHCKVELQIELPRELVKSRDVEGIEEYVAQIVQRHTDRESAEASALWNRREVEPYPEDYDFTLAEHSVWKAEQVNAAVEAKLDTAVRETSRVTDRVNTDPAYLSSFARGVMSGRNHRMRSCQDMMAFPFDRQNGEDPGYADGRDLTFGLELIRRLPECYVPVPDPPILRQARK